MSAIKYMNEKKEYPLGWYDPRSGEIFHAGFAVYNEDRGDYFLKIAEEADKRQFYLKLSGHQDGNTSYRLEMVTGNFHQKLMKRMVVGQGESTPYTNNNIHINYGSKYKILILFTGA